jgi:hypothetical protein
MREELEQVAARERRRRPAVARDDDGVLPPVSVANTSSTVASPSTAPSGGCIAVATSSCSDVRVP